MLTSDELNAAVNAGVIQRADADRLGAFLVEHRKASGYGEGAEEDSEAIRFVRGFHDVFLTIGVTLLLVGIGITTEVVASGIWPYTVAIAAWLLAEYFTRMKRLTLPSIALSIAFGVCGGLSLAALSSGILPAPETTARTFESPAAWGAARVSDFVPAIAAFVASALFYMRFRLPFTLAQMVVAAAALLAIYVDPGVWKPATFLIMGVLVFALALFFDLKDPERRTIATDNAFWLHLTAAPLIVHTTIGYVWADEAKNLTLEIALLTVAIIAALALVALVIDRRALLVAGLFYLGVALFIIIRNTAIEQDTVLALTILLLGGALVLLGVGWRPLRRALVNGLLPPSLARRLPTLRTE
jgi:hypothetical protein